MTNCNFNLAKEEEIISNLLEIKILKKPSPTLLSAVTRKIAEISTEESNILEY